MQCRRWALEEVALYIQEERFVSAATAIDFYEGDRSGASFQLSVSDGRDVEQLLTNSTVRWAKPHFASWEDAGHVSFTSFFDAYRARLHKGNDSHWTGNNSTGEGTMI